MSDRQSNILSQLRQSARTVWGLNLNTGYPAASIRRDIQSLRRQGWNIEQKYGVYSLKTA
jgi:predicted DNA-binding transcriptional regulator YafY